MKSKIKLMFTSAVLTATVQLVSACCALCPECCTDMQPVSSVTIQSESTEPGNKIDSKTSISIRSDEAN